MIFTALIAATSFAVASPAPIANADPNIQITGLFGKSKPHWVEVMQQVQSDYEYAPPAGRQAEAQPEPMVPTRYLTPEQRAIPVIVEPTPEYITRPDASETEDGTAPPQQAQAAQGYSTPTPAYLTSNDTTQNQDDEAAPAVGGGSATGSTATVNYGQAPK